MNTRVVTLVDMDCFYCQVEARLNPLLKGKPMAVVQYNEWKGGGIIAVNYEARDRGVTRYMRGAEAKTHCPEIELVRVPSVRGKADLTKYRDAGREVIDVICTFSAFVQRASIDEAYIDLTEAVEKRLNEIDRVSSENLANTFIVGCCSQGNDEDDRRKGLEDWLSTVNDDDNEFYDTNLKKLAVGALIVEEMRAAIYSKTGFRCSAGIANNKIMAKLVCGLHKPNRQTLLPPSGIKELFSDLPVQKVRSLGGKFGNDVIEKLSCKVMADLEKYSEKELQSYFDEKTGTWLYNIARGIDLDPVTPRLVSKSIGCCKQFRGKAALKTKNDVQHWIGELACEIAERLEEDAHMNKRKAQLLTVSVQQMVTGKKTPTSRSVPLQSYDPESIADIAYSALKRTNSATVLSDSWDPPLLFLGISVGKFVDDLGTSSKTINHYFQNNFGSCAANSSKKEIGLNNRDNISEVVSKTTIQSNSMLDHGDSEENKSKCTSFFERYFKNNKIFAHKSDSKDAVQSKSVFFVNDSSDASCVINGSKNVNFDDLFLGPSTSKCSADVIETVDECPYFNQNNLECENTTNKVCNQFASDRSRDNSEDIMECVEASWLSPSEIFPDLNEIDNEVLYMLPLPIQRKIIARINEDVNGNEKNISKLGNCENNKINNIKENQSSLDLSPNIPSTKITMMAEVHRDRSPSVNSLDLKTSNCSVNGQSNFNTMPNEPSNCIDNRKETLTIGTDSISLLDEKSRLGTKPLLSEGSTVIDRSAEGIEVCSEENNNSNNIRTNSNGISLDVALHEICSYCRESIPIVDMQQHMDHHIAVDLHRTLNEMPLQRSNESISDGKTGNTVCNRNNTKSKSPNKRKRPHSSSSNNRKNDCSESKKSKSILSFFRPK